MTTDQFIKMLELLLKKSRENKVHWQLEDVRSSEQRYSVEFRDGSTLRIVTRSPPSAPDYGSAVLIVTGQEIIHYQVDDTDSGYVLISELAAEAYRSTTKWDSALENIMQELSGSEDVGRIREDSVPF